MTQQLTKPKLLFAWVASNFQVLVPKKRGAGFLRVALGHHQDKELADVATAAGCDLFGLDGALQFDCGGAIFHGGNDARQAFESRVVHRLEAHYGFEARAISPGAFWVLHPFRIMLRA